MQRVLTVNGNYIRPEFIVFWKDIDTGVRLYLTTGNYFDIPSVSAEMFGKSLQKCLRRNSNDLAFFEESSEKEFGCVDDIF